MKNNYIYKKNNISKRYIKKYKDNLTEKQQKMNRYITPKTAEMATKYYLKNCSMLFVKQQWKSEKCQMLEHPKLSYSHGETVN